jgi:hypothetical protein
MSRRIFYNIMSNIHVGICFFYRGANAGLERGCLYLAGWPGAQGMFIVPER